MSDLVAQLKRLKPVSLKAVLRDGTDRPVAVPKNGNRWQRCERTLEGLDWEKVEALDKDGRVIGVVECADDDDEFDIGEDDGSVNLVKLAHVMMDVMRTTQKETRLMFEVQMKGQAELVEALIQGVRSISDSYSLAMKVQAAHAATDGDGDPEMMNMLKMAMALQMSPKQPARIPSPVTPSERKP